MKAAAVIAFDGDVLSTCRLLPKPHVCGPGQPDGGTD